MYCLVFFDLFIFKWYFNFKCMKYILFLNNNVNYVSASDNLECCIKIALIVIN